MYIQAPSSLITRHFKFIGGIGCVTAVVVMLLSFFQPLEYRAAVRILVTPVVASTGVVYDQYTALKSAEHIAETLSNVVSTILFQSKVLASPYATGLDTFDNDLRIRRKQWNKKIDPLVVKGSGVLVVFAYDEDKRRAEQLAGAIAHTLVAEAGSFLPGKVSVRIIDPPIASKFPMRPNLLLRGLLGFIFGGMIASAYVYHMPHTKHHDEFRLIS